MLARRWVATGVALTLVAGACTSSGSEEAATTEATFTVRPGVEMVTVTDAEPGTPLTLLDPEGSELLTLVTDDAGQAHYAYVPDEPLTAETGTGAPLPTVQGGVLEAGDGYVVREQVDGDEPAEASEPFAVLGRDDVADPSFYAEQVVEEGFGYVETRDGTTLSVMVRLPNPDIYGPPPYPTVIEYSGYSPSRPSEPEPGSLIAGLMGYATVGVNLRGSGCSGGVFDVFNAAQAADGYDVVETIAAQDWVANDQVGMVGLSYAGITQLYVAATAPPSLAGIAPLSVIDDPWKQQWPGGIYNDGFTKEWLAERDRQSAPGGSSWVTELIDEGDTTCEDNLELRSQNLDFEAFGRALEQRPANAEDRDLAELVREITAPVYLTGAWQDEQTGPRFAASLPDHFDNAEATSIQLFNGRHPDGYSPMVITRWWEFLELYVADRVPRMPDLIRDAAPAAFGDFFGVPGLGFEPDRFADLGDDQLSEARARFGEEPVRILFDSGAQDPPGGPIAGFELVVDEFPIRDAEMETWYLGPEGALVPEAPSGDAADAFEYDPEAGSTDFLAEDGYDLIGPLWDFDWTRFGDGAAVSYLTPPLDEDLLVVGPGYLDLWLQAPGTDADVQVTVSEVTAEGTEWWVQSGQLRMSQRALDEDASDDQVKEQSYRDPQPLEPGEWTQATVPVPAFGQAFRSGSRLRVTISTPGRDRARWTFETRGEPGEEYLVGTGGDHATRLVLPTVDGVEIPPSSPPCPSLRGQACRPFEPIANRSAG